MRDLGPDPCQLRPRSLWVSACFHCQSAGGARPTGWGQGSTVEGGGGGLLLSWKVQAAVLVLLNLWLFFFSSTNNEDSVFAVAGLFFSSLSLFSFFVLLVPDSRRMGTRQKHVRGILQVIGATTRMRAEGTGLLVWLGDHNHFCSSLI